MKIQKKKWGGSCWWGVGGDRGGSGGCEWRSEAFVKIQKKNFGGGGVGGQVRGGGVGLGGQGGWERRSEACVKIQKKNWGVGIGGSGWGGGGGQGGCEWRSEAFVKIQKKKNFFLGGGGGGSGQGVGWGGGVSGWMGTEN